MATPLCVLLFLASSDFFSGWDGVAVSYRAAGVAAPMAGPVAAPGGGARGDGASVVSVLVVERGVGAREVTWPRTLAEELSLPARPTAVPPREAPEDAVRTRKFPWTLSFQILPASGPARVFATTSPRSLSVALVAWIMGFALHNLALFGAPHRWWREEHTPQPGDPPSAGALPGVPPPAPPASVGIAARAERRPGPPPKRRRSGWGKR